MPTKQQLEAEIERLRGVIRKIMSDAGVPYKYGDEDLVTVTDLDGSWEVVPFRVAVLCAEYGLPWAVFYCEEHSQFIDEVGSSFPHAWDDMTCPKCRGEDE